MASINFGQALTFVGSIALEAETDVAALEAGQPVALPKVQIGTVGGKPLYLEANLSTT